MVRRNKLSPKTQWTMASVLIAILGVILLWKSGIIGPIEEEEVVAEASVSGESNSTTISLAELNYLIGTAQSSRVELHRKAGPFRVAKTDPFRIPSTDPRAENDDRSNSEKGSDIFDRPEDEKVDERPPRPLREEILESLILSAVFKSELWSRAVINGRYVSIGDLVHGFVVMDIAEREVVLQDDVGVEIIQILQPSWASDVEFGVSSSGQEREPYL